MNNISMRTKNRDNILGVLFSFFSTPDSEETIVEQRVKEVEKAQDSKYIEDITKYTNMHGETKHERNKKISQEEVGKSTQQIYMSETQRENDEQTRNDDNELSL